MSLFAGDRAETVPLAEDLTFPAPEEPGIYVYAAFARWDQGDASHAFHIEVE